MKTLEEIATAAAGLGIVARRESGNPVGGLASKQLDMLLWVLGYPNDFEKAFQLIKKLGIDGKEAVQLLEKSKSISSMIMEMLKEEKGNTDSN